MELTEILLEILNDEAEKASGSVIIRDKRYVVLDENGKEVYAHPESDAVASWMTFRNRFNIPFSAKRREKR